MKTTTIGLACFLLSAAPVLAQPAPSDVAATQRADEAALLPAFPKTTLREGDVLTIRRDERPVARFTDHDRSHCGGDESCSVWTFDGVVTLLTTPTHRETYAVVMHESGDAEQYMLIDEGGNTTWLDDEPMASPDRRYAALGATDGDDDGYFKIIDWPTDGHRTIATFDSGCEPVSWLSATAVKVVCSRDDNGQGLAAGVIRRTAPDTWQLQETGAVDDKTLAPITDAGFKPQTETVTEAVEPVQTPQDVAEDAAYDRKAGYEKAN